MSQDKVFADGFIFKRRENAPDFVIGNISVKVDEAIAFLKSNSKNGWVSMVISERREPSEKGATHYAYVNDYEPPKDSQTAPKKTAAKVEDDLPF